MGRFLIFPFFLKFDEEEGDIGYLYTLMESTKTLNMYKFFDAGSISCSSSKEERVQLLTARLLGTNYDKILLIPYNFRYMDNLKSFNITKKKKPIWRIMKVYPQCPKQSRVVECGYYVMRFMCDIILSKSTSIIDIVQTSSIGNTKDAFELNVRRRKKLCVGAAIKCHILVELLLEEELEKE
uniref:Ubiquitin-like protease family profile domain-containing protein n=1 Tax=Cucumis melo TaxID=3656 RepID=A0A9I9E4X0_CUCME